MSEMPENLKQENAQLRKKYRALAKKLADLQTESLKFSNFINQHDTIMLLVDPVTGQIVDANKAAEQFYGYGANQLRGINIRKIYANPDDDLKKIHDEADNDKKSAHVVAHKMSNGQIRQVEIHSSVIPYNSEKVIFSIILDVTERIESENRLQFEQTVQSLISSISAYFIQPDHHQIDIAINNALESIGNFMNSDYSFILRFSEDLTTFELSHQWHGKDLIALDIPTGSKTDDFPVLTGMLLRGDVFRMSDIENLADREAKDFYRKRSIRSVIVLPMISAGMVIGGIGLCTKAAQDKWTDESLTILRVIGEIIINTLIRKQTEDALRASEKKYRIFFEEDLTADYVAAADGHILFCNPAFVKIFGYDSVFQALQCNLKELDTSAGELTAILSTLKKKDVIESKEIELKRKDGEKAFVVGNFRGVYDTRGNLIESRGYLFDISDHKKTEEQLRGAQKMEAIGRLAGGVAHDFNNLLTVINGYGDLLLNSETFSESDKKRVGLIRKAGERAAGLTGQLLAFSRKQIVQLKIIDLNAVIIEFEKMLQRLIGENIEIINQLDPDLDKVKMDPTQLEQIIINLAVNARDAMPDGGKLYIRTSNVSLDRKFAIDHRPAQPGNYVLLEATDTGIGMDNETVSHVFEPFYTTKEKGKGTGLGLSTIYGIVKQANGYIWLESTPAKGTSFYIYFPLVKDEKEHIQKETIIPETLLHGNENILVVEDDPSVRELTCAFLETYGYRVHPAGDAKSAIDFFEKNIDLIDLAIIDVIMPDMGGKQLSTELQKRKPDFKVLFISGYTDDNIVRFGILNREVQFLQKPFNASQLAKKARQVLDSADAEN